MRHPCLFILCLGLVSPLATAREFDIPDQDGAALAAAIASANASPDADIIRLAPGGLYALTTASESGLMLPPVHGKLRIEGQGAEIRRYAAGEAALIQVDEDGELELRRVTLAEGNAGALRNFGRADLQQVHITDCSAAGPSTLVLNRGWMRLERSEIAYNELAGSGRDAGTVLNYGELQLADSAIHDNLAERRYATLAVAGAILNFGKIESESVRIADNKVDEDDGGPAFAGILNIGNGQVTGKVPAGTVADDSPGATLAQGE